MEEVILSLGSSLGDRKQILQDAVDEINRQIGKVEFVSNFYETEPWGFEDKNFFYNIAVTIKTEYSPEQLLSKIQEIETSFKRVRNTKNYEARTLDIDIIFYGNRIVNTDDLNIPHKFAHLRKFVLAPINELNSNFVHPIFNCSVEKLLHNCPDNSKVLKIVE